MHSFICCIFRWVLRTSILIYIFFLEFFLCKFSIYFAVLVDPTQGLWALQGAEDNVLWPECCCLSSELDKLRLKDTTTSPLTAAWSVGVTAKIKPRCISPPSTPHTHVIIRDSLRLSSSRMAMQNIELHLHHSADSSTFRPITYLANSINGGQV